MRFRLLITLALSACRVDLQTPGEITVECTASTDCPRGRVCVEGIQRCVAPGTACIEERGGNYVPSVDGNLCTLEGETARTICLDGVCVVSICGDAFPDLDGLEECDQGADNTDAPGVCRPGTCALPACGDETTDPTEQCDDGNDVDTDGCRNTCIESRCGDGVVNPATEDCDDQNSDNTDDCLNDCSASSCGDGITHADSEECDDGNDDDLDACTNDCTTARCGDERLQGEEVCDDGNALSGDGCRGDCLKTELCPDALLDTGEDCDDGNTNPNDGCASCRLTTWEARVLLGLGASEGDPRRIPVGADGIAADTAGDLYVSDAPGHRVWRIDHLTGKAVVFAGNGEGCYSLPSCGDGGPAVNASLNLPGALLVNVAGDVLIADTGTPTIRRVSAHDGTIVTVAGDGVVCSFPGAPGTCNIGGLATSARLIEPSSMAVNRFGNLYFSDAGFKRVLYIDAANGYLLTYAGDGGSCSDVGPHGCGDEGSSLSAQLEEPHGIAFDADGALYIADSGHFRIRRVFNGVIDTLIGTGAPGIVADPEPVASATLADLWDVALEPDGTLLFGDRYRVRRVDPARTQVTTLAGDPASLCLVSTAPCGDGGDAVDALLTRPKDLAITAAGVVMADDYLRRVRRLLPDGKIETVMGSGVDLPPATGEGATGFDMGALADIVRTADGRLLISANGTWVHVFDPSTGALDSVAGGGTPCMVGTCVVAGKALGTSLPIGVQVTTGPTGQVVMGEPSWHRLLQIDAIGNLAPFAGDGGDCVTPPCGDNGPALSAQLGGITDLTTTTEGVFILTGLMVRKVDAGNIFRVAGYHETPCPNAATACGDDGPAVDARFNYPTAMAADGAGNLYIADAAEHRIRQIRASDDYIVNLAGTGGLCVPFTDCGEDVDPLAATFFALAGVAATDDGTVYTLEYQAGGLRLRRIAGGIIHTLYFTDEMGFYGDGGPLSAAVLKGPTGLATDVDGNLLFADGDLVRKIDAVSDIVTTVVGDVDAGGNGPLGRARLTNPQALVEVGQPGSWLVADGIGSRLRLVDVGAGWVRTIAGYPWVQGLNTGGTQGIRYRSFSLNQPALLSGAAYDAVGQIAYVSDQANHLVWALDLHDADPDAWSLTSVVGVVGVHGYVVCAFPPCPVNGPSGLSWDTVHEKLFIADTDNNLVRILEDVMLTDFAGQPGIAGFAADGTPLDFVVLDHPEGVLYDAAHDALYIADTGNHGVRLVAGGVISTVIGNGAADSGASGQPASSLPIDSPRGLALDSHGNLFVTSRTSVRVIAAGADGQATGDDAALTIYGLPPRTTLPDTATECLTDLALADDEATLFLLDACQGFMLELDRSP